MEHQKPSKLPSDFPAFFGRVLRGFSEQQRTLKVEEAFRSIRLPLSELGLEATLACHPGVSAIGSPPSAFRGYATGPRFLGAFPQMRIAIDNLKVRHAPEAEQ